MAAKAKRTNKQPPAKAAKRHDVDDVLAALARQASPQFRKDMSERYGIIVKKAWGVPIARIQRLAKEIGADHALALKLWDTGWYEARLLASMIDDVAQVSPAQMDAWAKDFDNWGVVDTVFFKLFDRSPHAFAKIGKWSNSRDEFVKRAGVVLLACVALHDKTAPDEKFLKLMPVLAKVAQDERNFVKKGASWALRAIGAKKSLKLRAGARKLAQELAQSENPAARWVGKDALREFARKA